MNENMQKYLDKAQVLIEALPYIQRFNRKIIVVKYGGSAMVDESLKERVIQDVTLLKLCGFKPIIVHGGGKEISKWVGKVGMEPKFINGLRVTDEETMKSLMPASMKKTAISQRKRGRTRRPVRCRRKALLMRYASIGGWTRPTIPLGILQIGVPAGI